MNETYEMGHVKWYKKERDSGNGELRKATDNRRRRLLPHRRVERKYHMTKGNRGSIPT